MGKSATCSRFFKSLLFLLQSMFSVAEDLKSVFLRLSNFAIAAFGIDWCELATPPIVPEVRYPVQNSI